MRPRAAREVGATDAVPLRSGRPFLFALAFLEGVTAMATELLVAMMLAPLYGDSLYTWSAVLGTTLVGLAAGYYAGGVLVDRAPRIEVLLGLVLATAAYLLVLPALLAGLTQRLIGADPVLGAIGCAAVGLLPPLFLLGMVPSFLIRLLSHGVGESGEVAGRVYALSSIGGVTSALSMGLLLIPALGLALPALILSLVLALPPLAVLLSRRRYAAGAYLLLLPLAAADVTARDVPTRGEMRVKYFGEGLLGQVLVTEQNLPGGDPADFYRVLYLNRMVQSVMDGRTGLPLPSGYADYIAAFAATRPPGARVLLLGLGGGTLVKEFVDLGLAVDAVELDERIIDAADEHFLAGVAKDRVRYVADDARHFVRTASGRYDLVVFDVFRGERPPAHVFTRESLEEVKRLLADDGLVVLNLIGQMRGERSAGVRAILRTLGAVGFEVRVVALPEVDNVLVVASPRALDLSRPGNPRYRSRLERPIESYVRTVAPDDVASAPVLTDDRPMLEILYLDATEFVRRGYTRNFTEKHLEAALPLFR